MIPIAECRTHLNTTKGKKKYSDEQIKIIRDFLIRMAEIEYLDYKFKQINQNINENSNLHKGISPRADKK